MERDSIVQALHQFVLEQSNLDDPSILEPDTDLFEAGLLDSLMAVSLIGFCEERFGCEMDAAELSQEQFRSLNTLAEFVSRKLQAKSATEPTR